MKLPRYLVLLLLAFWSSAAFADFSESYSLEVTDRFVALTVRVNGLPIGVRENRPFGGVIFYLDGLLRAGDNDISVKLADVSPDSALGLVLTAPPDEPGGFQKGPELGQFACAPAPKPSTEKMCAATTVHFTIHRDHAPDLLLWHAEPATPDEAIAPAIAKALKTDTADLVAAARAHHWDALYFGNRLRRADLLLAGGSSRSQAADMAQFMTKADGVHPGLISALPAPGASELNLEQLPDNLVAVRRSDGKPLIRIQVGDGSVPGLQNQRSDPDDVGDFSVRYQTGVYQETIGVFGKINGRWELLR